MLKKRWEIKANAKAAMKEQWGTSILTLIIMNLVIFAGSIFWYIPILGILLVYATVIFIDSPLMIHAEGVFIKVYRRQETDAGELFSAFSINYWRKVGGTLWMNLWIFIWCIPVGIVWGAFVFGMVTLSLSEGTVILAIVIIIALAIVPIVKYFAYSMAPFILADCPGVTATEALKLSIRMTNGHKWKLFVMFLSFIGWYILGIFTFGILWLVFVNPYLYSTHAGYYVEIRDLAISEGTIDAYEFGIENGQTIDSSDLFGHEFF